MVTARRRSVWRRGCPRSVFPVPTSLADAFAFLRAVRAQPGHVSISPSARHLEVFERLCREADAVGDLAADAQMATFAVEQGGELVSFDRELRRFTSVRWSRPDDPG